MNLIATQLKNLTINSTPNLLFILNIVLTIIVAVTIVLPLLNIVNLT